MPIIGRHSQPTPGNWLSRYAKNVRSQFGEDGILEKTFEILAASGPRWCVEIGAWDGKHFSNTWNLLTNPNWHGVLIEADSSRFRELQETYRENSRVVTVNCMVQFEGPDTLDELLKKTPVPREFDLLNIDVDGNDFHIWESFIEYHPRLVLIEFNPTIPNELAFVQERDANVNQGNSLLAMVILGKQKGYELVATTSHNAFFVQKEFFPLFNISDNDIFAMHSPGPYESLLFQLYDGTLVLGGCDKLLWHGDIPMNQEAMQVLPPEARRFPGGR